MKTGQIEFSNHIYLRVFYVDRQAVYKIRIDTPTHSLAVRVHTNVENILNLSHINALRLDNKSVSFTFPAKNGINDPQIVAAVNNVLSIIAMYGVTNDEIKLAKEEFGIDDIVEQPESQKKNFQELNQEWLNSPKEGGNPADFRLYALMEDTGWKIPEITKLEGAKTLDELQAVVYDLEHGTRDGKRTIDSRTDTRVSLSHTNGVLKEYLDAARGWERVTKKWKDRTDKPNDGEYLGV